MNSPHADKRRTTTNKEMDSQWHHQVYELIPSTSVPRGGKPIRSRLVYKLNKARLVVQS